MYKHYIWVELSRLRKTYASWYGRHGAITAPDTRHRSRILHASRSTGGWFFRLPAPACWRDASLTLSLLAFPDTASAFRRAAQRVPPRRSRLVLHIPLTASHAFASNFCDASWSKLNAARWRLLFGDKSTVNRRLRLLLFDCAEAGGVCRMV